MGIIPYNFSDRGAVRPEQKGAVGDGSTDDSAAIQAAIDTGQAVILSSGKRYRCESAVVMNNNGQTMAGEGALVLGASTMDQVLHVSADNVFVRGIEVDGNYSEFNTSTGRSEGIRVSGNSCTIDNCYIHDLPANASANGIYSVGENDYLRITNTTIENAGYACIRCDNGRVDITNCRLWHSAIRSGYAYRTINPNRNNRMMRIAGGVIGASIAVELNTVFDIQGESSEEDIARTVILDGVTFDHAEYVAGANNHVMKFEGYSNITLRKVQSNIDAGVFLRLTEVASNEATQTVTFDGTADTITATGHNLKSGATVYFSTTGALPTGITAGTRYYVYNVTDANTFQLSETRFGDDVVDFTGTGSGTHTLTAEHPAEQLLIEDCDYRGVIAIGHRYKRITIRNSRVRKSIGVAYGLQYVEDFQIQDTTVESFSTGILSQGSETLPANTRLKIDGLTWVNRVAGNQYLFANLTWTAGQIEARRIRIFEGTAAGRCYLSNNIVNRMKATWDGNFFYYNPPMSKYYGDPIRSYIGSSGGRFGASTITAGTSTVHWRAHYGTSGFDATNAFPDFTDAPEGSIILNTEPDAAEPHAWIFRGSKWVPFAGVEGVYDEGSGTGTLTLDYTDPHQKSRKYSATGNVDIAVPTFPVAGEYYLYLTVNAATPTLQFVGQWGNQVPVLANTSGVVNVIRFTYDGATAFVELLQPSSTSADITNAGSFSVQAGLSSSWDNGTKTLRCARDNTGDYIRFDEFVIGKKYILSWDSEEAVAGYTQVRPGLRFTDGTIFIADAIINGQIITAPATALNFIQGFDNRGVDLVGFSIRELLPPATVVYESSSDPSDPPEGQAKIWMSDGTGAGNDGDLMAKVTAGGTTYTVKLAESNPQTGYTAFGNLVTTRTLDADATTLAEVADVLGTLIEDLKTRGIIAS